MKRLATIFIGLVMVWFFGLIALATLGMIAAIAFPPRLSPVPGGVHQQIHVAAHAPVPTQVAFDTIKSTGLNPELTVLFVGTVFLAFLLGGFALLWRVAGRSPRENPEDGRMVQELYHLGKSLETRMDALETILLDRQRPANGL